MNRVNNFTQAIIALICFSIIAIMLKGFYEYKTQEPVYEQSSYNEIVDKIFNDNLTDVQLVDYKDSIRGTQVAVSGVVADVKLDNLTGPVIYINEIQNGALVICYINTSLTTKPLEEYNKGDVVALTGVIKRKTFFVVKGLILHKCAITGHKGSDHE
jgi:hypothetical protein